KSEDAPAFARQIERLLEDPALRERLGRAARRTVEERYTDTAIAQRSLDYWRRALRLGASHGIDPAPRPSPPPPPPPAPPRAPPRRALRRAARAGHRREGGLPRPVRPAARPRRRDLRPVPPRPRLARHAAGRLDRGRLRGRRRARAAGSLPPLRGAPRRVRR